VGVASDRGVSVGERCVGVVAGRAAVLVPEITSKTNLALNSGLNFRTYIKHTGARAAVLAAFSPNDE